MIESLKSSGRQQNKEVYAKEQAMRSLKSTGYNQLNIYEQMIQFIYNYEVEQLCQLLNKLLDV